MFSGAAGRRAGIWLNPEASLLKALGKLACLYQVLKNISSISSSLLPSRRHSALLCPLFNFLLGYRETWALFLLLPGPTLCPPSLTLSSPPPGYAPFPSPVLSLTHGSLS